MGGGVLFHSETVLVRRDELSPHLAIVELTRSDQLNSFTSQQYEDLSRALDMVNGEESISVAVLSARGRFYSSGHDLRQQLSSQVKLAGASEAEQTEFLKSMIESNAHQLIVAFIRFEKPLIAAVNGPAVGVACTTLQLCDIVYCADIANFHVPFMQLGFCAEGCSSLLFPMIMGTSKANELLLMGKKMNAEEAKQCGFVADFFPSATFMSEVLQRARQMAAFPPNALRQTKGLSRKVSTQTLLDTNERELSLLLERFRSEECAQAVMKFVMEQQTRKASKM